MATPQRFSDAGSREYRERLLSVALANFGNLSRGALRQKQSDVPTNKWERYRDDPVGFVQQALREFIWSKQREIAESIVLHDRVAVKSCHESGKSFLAGRIPAWWIAAHPQNEAFVVTSAPSFAQVRAILWREINRAHSRGALPGYTNQTEWFVNDELVAFGRKPNDMDPTAFQGYHAQFMLVVFDEACGMPASLWTAAETLVANEGGKILAIGNPDDPNTEFAKICKPGSGWHVITISAHDTPNFTGERVPDAVRKLLISKDWVEKRRKSWGETSPLYVSKVLGEFPEVSEDSLVPISWVRQAAERILEPDDSDVELGVDVARSENGNETVVMARRGRVARIYGTLRVRDLMRVCGLIVQAIRELHPRRVKIDDAGLGGGVTDRLKEMQREGEFSRDVLIVPVLVGTPLSSVAGGDAEIERQRAAANSSRADLRRHVDAAPMRGQDILRFRDIKAQINWHTRTLFETGAIDIDPDDLDLQAQTCAIRYDLNSRGQIVIEGKDELKKRLTEMQGITGESGSPDRWDALVLAFADVGAPSVADKWRRVWA